jgi:hypothetical protein
MVLDECDARQPATGKDLVHDELEELQVAHGDRQVTHAEFVNAWLNDVVQQHDSIGRQQLVGAVEEGVVAVEAEVLEGADGCF